MADIILPDDVFVNMQNAQEEAKSMKEAVTEFNKNVSEKFTDKDADKDAKVENDVNPRLTTSEKTRYRNIGSAFFEGAKTQILDIFKEIEKNKKKNIFRRTTAAVREQMEQIKEFAEEHKTHGKILLAIAAIGGIYYLFKDWFDENMPKIWDKLTNAISEFADAAGKLASEIATKITDSNILGSIKDFIVNTGKDIANFFKTLGGYLSKVFKTFDSPKNTVIYNAEREAQDIVEKQKDIDPYHIYQAVPGGEDAFNDLEKNQKQLIEFGKRIDELQELADKGEQKTKDGKNVQDELEHARGKYAKFKESNKEILDQIERLQNELEKRIENYIKHNSDNSERAEEIRKLVEDGKIYEAAEKVIHNTGILKDIAGNEDLKSALPNFKKALEDTDRLEYYNAAGLRHNDGRYDSEPITFVKAVTQMVADAAKKNNKPKTPEEGGEEGEGENKEAKDAAEKKAKENLKRIQNANLTKLTNVAVISTLDEFVKNFFDGDQPGSFKVFSKQFLDSVKQIAGSFEIAKNIGEHVENIYNKVNGVIDSITKNLEEIGTALSTNTDSIKTFIADRFKNEGISQLADRLDNILKEEAKQVSFLSQQNSILEQTNKLLETMQAGNNANVSITPATTQNDGFSIDDTPTANSMAINNMYIAGAGLA